MKRERKFNQLVLATKNSGKVKEFQKYFSSLNIKIVKIDDIIKDVKEPKETGATFEENEKIKAIYYSKFTDKSVISEDSGLVIPYLNNYPGVYSSRIGKSDSERINKILEKLKGIEGNKRVAYFVSVLALAENGKIIKTFSGKVKGYIIKEPKGNNGFGYDPVFYYKPIRKTFAQISSEEKNKYSHRGRAIKKLIKFITNFS